MKIAPQQNTTGIYMHLLITSFMTSLPSSINGECLRNNELTALYQHYSVRRTLIVNLFIVEILQILIFRLHSNSFSDIYT